MILGSDLKMEFTTASGTKKLTLRPWQIDHFNKVDDILQKNHCYIDTSPTGTGKTYNLAAIALKYGFTIAVCCPKAAIEVWEKICREYEIPYHFIIGYESLRSITGKQPKHQLLTRTDTENRTYFTATDKFMEMARHGIFLVLDEIQHLKNDSDQYKACKALTTACMSLGGGSRFALISASPFDKEELAVNLIKLAGYIQHPKLFMYFRELAEIKLYGAQELIDVCKSMNPTVTQRVLSTYPLDHKNVPGLCYRLFVEVLMPVIASAMPPLHLDIEKDIKNGYYNMDPTDAEALNRAITELSLAARYNPYTQSYDSKNASWGAIQTAQIHSETAKIGIFVRLARTHLSTNPRCKVILFVNYIDTIHTLAHRLNDYNPMVMYGDTPQKERVSIIERFQTKMNDRLLIANTQVGCESINLHDIIGDSPRYTYISPNYSILRLHQATGRTYRDGTKSKATIRFVYGKIGARETSILNALSRKSRVLHETLTTQVEHGVQFPGEYADEIEP
jgi:superfamily II DNA or RNA helicase